MKEQPKTSVTYLRNSSSKHKIERLSIPQELISDKFYIQEKLFRTQKCRRKFVKNLLPEKRKENM